MLIAAPIFYQRMFEHSRFSEVDVSCIKLAHTGGATVSVKLLKAWSDRGVFVRQIYGQTECPGTINPQRYALSHPDSCGCGSILRDIDILDENGKSLPAGQVGEIALRGYGMMPGYWNDPDATAATIVDGWVRTGDMGVIDELGLLKFVDRKKDIIISGGINISAAEVERVILELPGIEEVAVVAAPDDKFGETPFAIVHARSEVDVPALIAHCNRNLSRQKVPRYIAVSPDPLPRLSSGKISKPALRQTYLKDRALPERVR
jgi:fatty-acyl-CoA synthase